jgi:hypothetical protein
MRTSHLPVHEKVSLSRHKLILKMIQKVNIKDVNAQKLIVLNYTANVSLEVEHAMKTVSVSVVEINLIIKEKYFKLNK